MSAVDIARTKRRVYDGLRHLYSAAAADLGARAREVFADDVCANIAHPINAQQGTEAVLASWLRPLFHSFPDLERRDDIVLAGEFEGKSLVACMGCYQGTFTAPFLEIPPTQNLVRLRYGELHEIGGGRIVESWILADFIDLMHQARCWPLAPSLGHEGTWLSPATHNGVQPDVVDAAGGTASLAIIHQMHAALLSFDGKNLDSMDHAKYWTPNFMWYGPSGIGTTRGLQGFRAHHQIPFLRAVPDRTGGNNRFVGDGKFTMNGGWPGMSATHTGGNWLGLAPTGKPFTIRVMDFYRIENALIAENWVPIDLLNILDQLGLNVFDRMRHHTGRPTLAL